MCGCGEFGRGGGETEVVREEAGTKGGWGGGGV